MRRLRARALRTGRTRVVDFDLIRKHHFQLRLIGVVRHRVLTQLAFSRASLGSQYVAAVRVVTDNLARPGLLEPLRRTFVSL